MKTYKDKNGEVINIGDPIAVKLCTGRYGCTQIVTGEVVEIFDAPIGGNHGRIIVHAMTGSGGVNSLNFKNIGKKKSVSFDSREFIDFEHGHTYWAVKLDPEGEWDFFPDDDGKI